MSQVVTTTARSIGVITTEIKTITRQTQQMVLSSAIEIGRRLMEAKELVPHGEWGAYLQKEVEFSQSTANNFMQIYKEYGNDQQSLFAPNSQAIGKLNYTQALRLLALPAEEREEFMEAHDVSAMSTRELEKAIKERDAATEEAERLRQEMSEAEAKILTAQKEQSIAEMNAQAQKGLAEEAKARAEAAEKKAKAVAELEGKLKTAKKEAKDAQAALKAAQENPDIPAATMEAMQKEAEAKAAEEVRKQVEAELAAAKEAAERAKSQLEAAQKAARMADPDIMAVQALGQQVLSIWNTMLGHRMKAVQANPENEKPMEGFLRKLLETLQAGV